MPLLTSLLARATLGPGCALLFLFTPGPCAAQQPMNMPETKSQAPYHPGLGELMTAFVQPRHIKLGLAGKAGNRPYAGYELGELGETFADIAQLVPTHDGMAIPEMIAATVKPPIAKLGAAIKAKNTTAFTKAYADLTRACNACHRSSGHAAIVIQVPTVSSFPDQDFRPSQK